MQETSQSSSKLGPWRGIHCFKISYDSPKRGQVSALLQTAIQRRSEMHMIRETDVKKKRRMKRNLVKQPVNLDVDIKEVPNRVDKVIHTEEAVKKAKTTSQGIGPAWLSLEDSGVGDYDKYIFSMEEIPRPSRESVSAITKKKHSVETEPNCSPASSSGKVDSDTYANCLDFPLGDIPSICDLDVTELDEYLHLSNTSDLGLDKHH